MRMLFWLFRVFSYVVRELYLQVALRQRRGELAHKFMLTNTVYNMCRCTGFKPGAQERMDAKMRSLYFRVHRITRRIGRRPFRWHRQLAVKHTPDPLLGEQP